MFIYELFSFRSLEVFGCLSLVSFFFFKA
uniref:Uncharacterized protein n=1 Tax=Rhizophora mucronata TaxID=61149 RepID=A0A2P2Q1D0_RHIMU